MPPTSAAPARESLTSTVSWSTPWTDGARRLERGGDRRADPVRRARDERDPARESGTRQPSSSSSRDFLDAGLPDPQHVVVGALVVAAERAVAEQLAHRRGGLGCAAARCPASACAPGGCAIAVEPRPREVLHPGGVAARRGRSSRRPPGCAGRSTSRARAPARPVRAAPRARCAGRPRSLPPWPLTSRKRRKPWPCSESSRSRSSAP